MLSFHSSDNTQLATEIKTQRFLESSPSPYYISKVKDDIYIITYISLELLAV